jgi:endogenous inhibitor of DNA gyrase (YacG/DUF329 family)
MNFVFRVECNYCKKDTDLSSTDNYHLMVLEKAIKADKVFCSKECQELSSGANEKETKDE